MYIVRKTTDLLRLTGPFRDKKETIGFVPTMGALHQGHLSLISRCAEENKLSICSIFVNPTQFNHAEDLENYPRSLDEDIRQLSEQGRCDILFLPSVSEMYPEGTTLQNSFQLGSLEHIFEGKFRPGHFQGVAHIVYKLLQCTTPHRLYIGQKDYQQCLIIKKMLEQKALQVDVVTCPISREEDGLAMSSRNRRLTEPQRNLAGLLYQCLISIQAQKGRKDFATVQKECRELLMRKGFKPDYVALADADTLEELSQYDPNRSMVALLAASIGPVRLIDNLLV